jgi:hypothetical protein
LPRLLDEPTLVAVVRVALHLTALCGHTNLQVVEKARLARSAVFVFIFLVLEQKVIAQRGFANIAFVHGLLNQVLDPSLNNHILSVIRQYLSGADDGDRIQLISDFFAIFFERNFDVQAQVALAIMQCVNASILHNAACSLQFERMTYAAIGFLTAHPSSEFLDQLLQLWYQLLMNSHEMRLRNIHLRKLSAAIRKSEKGSPSEATFSRLLGMLSGLRSTRSSAFGIRRRPIILVIMSVCETAEHSVKYVSVMNQLCSQSSFNCMECHLAELDLLLLRVICAFPNPIQFRGFPINLVFSESDVRTIVLPLIATIVAFTCSPQVIANMIAIGAPRSDRPFPPFTADVLSVLSSQIACVYQEPEVLLRLGYPDSIITVRGMSAIDLDRGFTFQCLLFLDGHAARLSSKKPCLLTIREEGANQFIFYFQGVSLVCRVKTSMGLSLAALTDNFPSMTWTLLSIGVRIPRSGPPSVSVSIGNQKPMTFGGMMTPFRDGALALALGGIADCPDQSDTDPVCFLGSFRILSGIAEEDPLDNSPDARPIELLPLLSYPGQEPHPDERFSVIMPEKLRKSFPTLTTSLSHTQIVKYILPYFLYLDRAPDHSPEVLIDLLGYLVLTCSEAQKHLYYIPEIAQMLMLCPPDKLTYTVYLKFFSLIEHSTDQIVITSLVVHILLSIGLWFASKSPHVVRICSHWSQSLCVTCPQVLHEWYSFSDMLSMIRIFFWFDPVEVDIIRGDVNSSRPRAPDLDVETCRQHLNRLLLAMAGKGSDRGDLMGVCSVLLSHCAVCADTRQVITFLRLLIDILSEKPLALPESKCNLLYCHFAAGHPILFVLALEVLCRVAGADTSGYLHTIIAKADITVFSEELLEQCLGLLPRFGVIYPVCCFIALGLPAQCAVMVAQGLASLDGGVIAGRASDPLWAFWPLLLLLKLPKSETRFVFRFFTNVIACGLNLPAFDTILTTWDLIGCRTNYEIEATHRDFILQVIDEIFDHFDFETQLLVVFRCLKLLLLHVNPPANDGLRLAYIDSPFFDNVPDEIPGIPEVKSLDDVLAVFCSPSTSRTFRFGLILGESGQPLHAELFTATHRLLETIQTTNDMITCWCNQFSKFANHRPDSHQCISLNLLVPVYFEHAGQLHIRSIFELRQAILSHYRPARPQLFRQDSDAAVDLHAISETIHRVAVRNSRRLRRFIRQNMHDSSPWSDPGFLVTSKRRMFFYGPSHTQPLMERYSRESSTAGGHRLPTPGVKHWLCDRITLGKEVRVVLWRDANGLCVGRDTETKTLAFDEITQVLVRNRFNRATSLEIFTSAKIVFSLDFRPTLASEVLAGLKSGYSQLPPPAIPVTSFSDAISQQWIDSKISTFAYLMTLNEFSGRSYNDISCYPIFPWIISNFGMQHETVRFRNLTQPVASQATTFHSSPSRPSLLAALLGQIEPFSSLPNSRHFSSLQEMYDWCAASPEPCELPPEFFFLPECFVGLKLPDWCSNDPDEFVYMHRKFLESDDVSATLPRWIDLIFGYAACPKFNVYCPQLFDAREASLREIGSLPTSLFSSPHPQRRLLVRVCPCRQGVVGSIGQSILCACILEATPHAISVLASDTSGSITIVRVDVQTGAKTATPTGSFPQTGLVFGDHHRLVAVTAESGAVVIVGERGFRAEFPGVGQIRCAAASEGCIYLAASEGQVWRWPLAKARADLLCCVTRDYVRCIAVSDSFGILAVGTSDGGISVLTVRDGTFLWAAEVDRPPKTIIVTEAWGFVLVETAGRLWLFNINGKQIRRIEVDWRIQCAITWKSERDCDFFAIADRRGVVRVFESFFMNTDEMVWEGKNKVVGMAYAASACAVFTVTENGDIAVIPRVTA